MEVKYLKIKDLKPYAKNPRVNGAAVKYVVKSIKANGFNQPIVVDQNLTICVGHTRLLAAKEMGLDTVPCYVKEMSKEQFIAYNLADNKTSEYAKWDEDLLKQNMIELSMLDDAFLDGTGFDSAHIKDLLEEFEGDNTKEEKDYSKKNKEINTNEYGDDLDQECPKCGFEYSSKD